MATVYDLMDLVDGRFRFVLGSRHSMGQGYAYPVSVLRGDVDDAAARPGDRSTTSCPTLP